MEANLQNENIYQNHIEWVTELNIEYNQLLEEQDTTYSPCTRTRNIRRIWNDEWRRPPRVDRQNAINKPITITVNL